MVEQFVNLIMETLRNTIPDELIAFAISVFPVLEIRGGMIAARLLEIPFLKAFLFCYIGNMLPIPFIILFIRKIFEFLRRFDFFKKIQYDKTNNRQFTEKIDKTKESTL